MPLLLAGLALLITGCAPGVGGSLDVPADHTRNYDGVLHAEGAGNPHDNCAECHGITERADVGVACIDCHSASSLTN